MDYSELDSLMAITKKGDAAQAKKIHYNQLIKRILGEEGYSKQAEKYIYGGFSFSGSEALAEHIVLLSENERREFFAKITSGELFYSNEKGITFKILISLLGCLLSRNINDLSLIRDIISKIPGLSVNKENKRWGDTDKIIEKYFVSLLPSDTELPSLSDMDINHILLSKFKVIFLDSIKVMKPSKDITSDKIDKIRKWLTQDEPETEVETPERNERNEEKEEDCPEESKNNKINGKKPKKSELLKSIANYLDNIENEVASLRNTKGELEYKNSSLEKEILRYKDELNEKELNLSKEIKQKELLYQENLMLKNEVDKLTKQVKELHEEIQKCNAVLAVFESDKESSQKAQLNSIASKLKAEYRDFKDALDMDMSIELGENMRQQLSTVFRILSKNGIDIEGRA